MSEQIMPSGIEVPEQFPAGKFARRVYDQVGPMTSRDRDNDFALAIFIDALGVMFQETDDWASDDEGGEPGWSILVDINRAPVKALPWLAQFIGVTLPKGLPEADQRALIKDAGGWRRGTPASMRAAIQPLLTGSGTVIFRERFGGAYRLAVKTYASETPDPAAVQRALLSQKPAGIILTYTAAPGQDYEQVNNLHPNYQDVFTDYPTYQGVAEDQPGA
jgi:Phage tail protein (Tail_P2_I)